MAKTIHMLWVYTMTTASRDRECSFYKHLPQETLLISFKQSSQGSNTSFTIWDCYLKTRLSCGMARKVGGTSWAEHSCERQRKKKAQHRLRGGKDSTPSLFAPIFGGFALSLVLFVWTLFCDHICCQKSNPLLIFVLSWGLPVREVI